MKKALFLHKAPLSVRVPLPDAEPGDLRSDDSSDSSVPASQRTVSKSVTVAPNNSGGPYDM